MSRVFKVGIGPAVNLGIFIKNTRGPVLSVCPIVFVCLKTGKVSCMHGKGDSIPCFQPTDHIRLSLNVVFSVIGISH